MQFIIKPDDTSVPLLHETLQYRQVWAAHARSIRRSFRQVTGLDFQQRTITAHVFSGRQSNAGGPYSPMKLAGDYRTLEMKLATLVHELSHRLLGGNVLGVVNLGLAHEGEGTSGSATELDHRHIYLFEYDVMQQALGETGAQICRQYEGRSYTDGPDPHQRAWEWAMSLSYEQRQRAVQWLAAKRVLREQWPEWNTRTIERMNPRDWVKRLEAAAN